MSKADADILDDILERLAHRWRRQADELDAEWCADDMVASDSEESENHGAAIGLRQAAGELLVLIDRQT